MIKVEALSKRYRDNVAIEDLSFEVSAGEVVGFLGPNGAGKSTTMRILAGALPASGGRAEVAGFDVFEQPLEVKAQVGYLPEIPPLYLDLSVRGYLRFCAQIKGMPKGQLKAEVERVAALAGVEHILRRLVRNISKGYRQRVGLAQALIGSPKLLILDEPTVGLDPLQVEQLRALIAELSAAGEHTILLSTHILSEVKASCERIIMLARGSIVADAKLSELEAEHGLPLEQVFSKLALGA